MPAAVGTQNDYYDVDPWEHFEPAAMQIRPHSPARMHAHPVYFADQPAVLAEMAYLGYAQPKPGLSWFM